MQRYHLPMKEFLAAHSAELDLWADMQLARIAAMARAAKSSIIYGDAPMIPSEPNRALNGYENALAAAQCVSQVDYGNAYANRAVDKSMYDRVFGMYASSNPFYRRCPCCGR